jgi:hypothetical protein
MGDQMDVVSRVFSNASRLSIIVPLQSSTAAFEETLISVLENRPAGAEILVCHDGRYDDPFDLCDEVRFVTADSPDIMKLISAGASAANGRFVHVIASGVKATEGWCDAALEKFEHFDCGSVAPVVRSRQNSRILAAGWKDAVGRLCTPASSGSDTVEQPSRISIGAYLQTSFWRTDLLCSLADAMTAADVTEANVAYEHLSRDAGWRCVVAEECDLVCEDEDLLIGNTGFARGMKLRGLRNHFECLGWSTAIQSSVMAALVSVFTPKLLSEAIGQAFGAISAKRLQTRIKQSKVIRCDERLRADERKPRQQPLPLRRAA